MKFHYPNAFSINHLGLGGSSFPFSYEIEKEEEVFGFSIFPIQLISIADILEKYADIFLVAFELGHYWTDDSNKILSFPYVAEEQKIDFVEFDKQTIGFEKVSLTKLLTDFSHYNFTFFDSASEPSFEQVYEDYLIWKSHDWKSGKKILSKLKNSNNYVSSHDDCYLYIETKRLDFLKEIFERNLQFLVALKDFQDKYSEDELEKLGESLEVKIADIPDKLSNQILSIIIFQNNVTIENRVVKIPFSKKTFDFQKEQDYKIEGLIIYDFNKTQWNFEVN